jgi:hypothetical protein
MAYHHTFTVRQVVQNVKGGPHNREEGNNQQETKFPYLLYDLLEDAEMKGFESIVSWLPGGNSFKVHDHKSFMQSTMPRYFKQTRYKSFQRQLNFYKFARAAGGPNKGAYSHQYLIRGKRELCQLLRRNRVRAELPPTRAKLPIMSEQNLVLEIDPTSTAPLDPCLLSSMPHPSTTFDLLYSVTYPHKSSSLMYVADAAVGTSSSNPELSKTITFTGSCIKRDWLQEHETSLLQYAVQSICSARMPRDPVDVHLGYDENISTADVTDEIISTFRHGSRSNCFAV